MAIPLTNDSGATVNAKYIDIKVVSMTTEYDCGETITAGDFDAYVLDIDFMNVDNIEGTCNLHFVRGDGETMDTFGVIDGNHIRHILHSGLYEIPHLTCYVQFVNSNLYTPLKIVFSGIRLYPTGVPISTLDPYPEWISLMIQLENAVEDAKEATNAALSAADDLTTLTELVQSKLDNGDFKGDKGDKGDAPAHEWNGYSLRFKNVDGSWGHYTNLRGATGKTAYQYATENGWVKSESVFGNHLANVDRLFYDNLRSEWVYGVAVTQAQMEDLIANEQTDPYTVYFVELPEGV